jgi:hypothetical protein
MFTADFPKSIIILGLSAKIKEKQKKIIMEAAKKKSVEVVVLEKENISIVLLRSVRICVLAELRHIFHLQKQGTNLDLTFVSHGPKRKLMKTFYYRRSLLPNKTKQTKQTKNLEKPNARPLNDDDHLRKQQQAAVRSRCDKYTATESKNASTATELHYITSNDWRY